MENLKIYLNNLFMGIPETPAVLRAKAELLEMMEDKYEELINEGKSDKEAFGTVISEFGNLDELAEALGISEQLQNSGAAKSPISDALNTAAGIASSVGDAMTAKVTYRDEEPAEIWSGEKMSDFLKLMWTHARTMAIGIALFIATPGLISVLNEAVEALGLNGIAMGSVSALFFFALIAVGVVLCVHSGHIFKTFGYYKNRRVGLSLEAAELLKNQREAETNKLYYMLIAGIILCIFAVLPTSIFHPGLLIIRGIVDNSVLFMVAIGVYLLVVRGSIMNRYKEFGKAKLYNESQTSEINAGYFVEPQPKKLSGTGIALIIISIVLVFGIIIISLLATLFGAVKKTGSWIEENWDTDFTPAITTEEMSELESYSAKDIEKIVVDGDAVNVIISESDDDQIHVSFNGSGNKPVLKKEGSSLVIDCSTENDIYIWNFKTGFENMFGTINVSVPKNAELMDYEYKMDAGKIEMKNLSADEMEFDTDASDVSLKNVTAAKLTVTNDAGALRLEDCNIDNFKVEVDAAAIKAKNTSFKNADIKNDAGAIDIETAEGYESYDLDIDTDFAAVKIGDKSYAGNYKESSKNSANGNHSIKIKADASSIKIQ